jgi:hypothetical protein
LRRIGIKKRSGAQLPTRGITPAPCPNAIVYGYTCHARVILFLSSIMIIKQMF